LTEPVWLRGVYWSGRESATWSRTRQDLANVLERDVLSKIRHVTFGLSLLSRGIIEERS
jgi:hypothetical protein